MFKMLKKTICLILAATFCAVLAGCDERLPLTDDYDPGVVYSATRKAVTLPKLSEEQKLFYTQDAGKVFTRIIQTGAGEEAIAEAVELGKILSGYSAGKKAPGKMMVAAGNLLCEMQLFIYREADMDRFKKNMEAFSKARDALDDQQKIYVEQADELNILLSAFTCNQVGQKNYDESVITLTGDVGFCDSPDAPEWRTFSKYYKSVGYDPGWVFENCIGIFSMDDLTVCNNVAPYLDVEPEDKQNSGEDEDGDQQSQEASRLRFAPPRAAQMLGYNSIELVNLASQYNMDYGQNGRFESERYLKDQGIAMVDEGRYYSTEIKGLEYIFLSYNYPDKPNAELSEKIANEIRSHKKENNAVIACFNWGKAYRSKPSDAQQQIAYAAVYAGADMVVGNGPREIQGAEIYKDKYIFYSLGELVNGDNFDLKTRATLIITAKFALKDGQTQFRGLTAIPLDQNSNKKSDENDYTPMPRFGQRGRKIIDEVVKRSAGLKNGVKELPVFDPLAE